MYLMDSVSLFPPLILTHEQNLPIQGKVKGFKKNSLPEFTEWSLQQMLNDGLG